MPDSQEEPVSAQQAIESRKKCGIVMPISAIDGCSEQHWSEVKSIITDSIESSGFSASLVSDADDVGIIQKRIIQNLFDNPIVVCDVSCKNPNVMFELGMRLAFDKPTIIVKDDKTTYSFDTSPIEHLEYPRDLRFARIVDFKKNLADKIKATVLKAEGDPNYTTFLKHFGKFAVANLETTEVSKEDFIIEELRELRKLMGRREAYERAGIRTLTDRDRELARAGSIADSNESERRKHLRMSIDAIVTRVMRSSMDKDMPSRQDLEIQLFQELISNPEVRNLADSTAEIEELLHKTLRNYLRGTGL